MPLFPRPALILCQDTVNDPGEWVELRTRPWSPPPVSQAEPRTPASWLLSADRSQTAAPLPVGSDPRSVRRTEPFHKAPLPSSPALGRYAKGLPAAVILLRRNRTDRPLQ